MAPMAQGRDVASAIFQDAIGIGGVNEIRNRLVPSREHLLQLVFPAAGRVDVVRRHVRGGIPCEAAVTGVEDSESFSSAPGLAVSARGNCAAVVLGSSAPDRVTAVDGIGGAE